ncbi:MAG: hypothetical protein WC865_12115 [Bacteroidales bacterium]
MDVIADAQSAIDEYNSLTDCGYQGGGYLHIYGLLQALFIQQDAVSNLNKALFDQKIDFKGEYPSLFRIREQRNDSIGHPTNRGNGRSFHGINRSSMSKRSMKLMSFDSKPISKVNIAVINLMENILMQETDVNKILTMVLAKIQEELNTHKAKFRGNTLSKLFTDELGFEISKLYQGVGQDHELIELVELNFKSIRNTYEKIKDGLTHRYCSVEALPGVKNVTDLLDYIFIRLNTNLLTDKTNDDYELLVFIDALKHNINLLKNMVIEIDQEFDE